MGLLVFDKFLKFVNDKFQIEYFVEKCKEILQKYKVLSNCNELFVFKVNLEIWFKLNVNFKRLDIRILVLQDILVKVFSVIIVIVNDLFSYREKKMFFNYKIFIFRLIDFVVLIGYVYKEFFFK